MPISNTADLLKFLKQDRDGKVARFPDQAIPALEDKRVAKLVDKRLAAGEKLSDIADLGYDVFTGINKTLFSFDSAGQKVGASAILVMEKAEKCEVVGIVEDFDSTRPNTLLPAFPREGAQPFVLDRPSTTEELVYDRQILGAADARARVFLEQFGLTADKIDGNGTLASTQCTAIVPQNTIVAPSLMGEPYPTVQDYCEIEMTDDS